MTDFEHEHAPVDPSAEGQRRAAAWQAHMEASLAASTEVQQHAPVSSQLRSAHRGLFGDATGADLAASLREGPATVGTSTDSPRSLPMLGGTDWESQGAGAVAPVPARVYRQDTTQQPGISPLLAYMQGRQ